MMAAGAVSHAQPSVTKVGGITEFLKIAALADELGVRLVPHSRISPAFWRPCSCCRCGTKVL
jgi:L-alanine-DL-glutamate epimerase-like enolase superfamily enzyme